MRKFIAFLGLLILSSGAAFAGQDILIANGVHAATNSSALQYKTTETGVHVVLNVTVVPGVDTVTLEIDGEDYYGNIYPVLIGAAISTTGKTVYKVGPGLGQIANNAAADMLPDIYFVKVTHSAGTNFTYSVAANKEKY